jgi:hypothetical protein
MFDESVLFPPNVLDQALDTVPVSFVFQVVTPKQVLRNFPLP